MKLSLLLSAALLAALTACGGGGSSSASASGSGSAALPTSPGASAPVANASSMAALPDLASGQVHWDACTSASTPDGVYQIASDTGYTTALGDVLLVDAQGTYHFVGHLPTPQTQGASVYVPGTGLLVLGGTPDFTSGTDAISLVTPAAIALYAHLSTPRVGETACLLGGKVLVVGGYSAWGQGSATASTAELFDPASKTSVATGALVAAAGTSARVFALASGQAMLVDPADGTTQIFDPTTNTWTAGPVVHGLAPQFGGIVAQVGNKIFVGGGYASTSTGTTFYDLGAALDTTNLSAGWYESAWPYEAGEKERSYAMPVVSGGKLAMVGGYIAQAGGVYTFAKTDRIFDPTNPYSANAWTADTFTRCPSACPAVVGVLPSGQIVVQPDDHKADATIFSPL